MSNDNRIWRLPLWSCIVVTDANSIGKMRSSAWIYIYYMLIIWKHILTAKNIVDMLYLNYLGFLHWRRGCRCACLKMDLLKETLRTQISNPFSSCIIFFEIFLTFHLFAVLPSQKFVSVDQKKMNTLVACFAFPICLMSVFVLISKTLYSNFFNEGQREAQARSIKRSWSVLNYLLYTSFDEIRAFSSQTC